MLREMGKLVVLRVEWDESTKPLGQRYGVTFLPTLLFVRPDGTEVDRIVGMREPDELLAAYRGIRSGRTTDVVMGELANGRGGHAQLLEVAQRLVDRRRYLEAFHLLGAFHRENSLQCCEPIDFRVRALLQQQVYERTVAALAARKQADSLPAEAEIANLQRLLDGRAAAGLGRNALADHLREARRADVLALLARAPLAAMKAEQIYETASLAFKGGHYRSAARLYALALEDARLSNDAWRLGDAARDLLTARIDLESARSWASRAYELRTVPALADTLARVYYEFGERDHAIELERVAARRLIEAGYLRSAHDFSRTLAAMRESRDLGQKPPFESYPQELRGGRPGETN